MEKKGRREAKYHLLTANFEHYDFNKLFNEEKDFDKKILWKIGSSDGKNAQNYNIGDVCYIYYGNLPDGTKRILLRGEVIESDTDINTVSEQYSYDENKKIKGIWLSDIKAIALDDPKKFNAEILSVKYDKSNIQGQQYLNAPNEMRLVEDLEKSTNKNLDSVRKYFDDYTKCFFAKTNKRMHSTFTSGRGLNYYEKHHFILKKYIEKNDEQQWLIKEHNNLIHLCPTCHRKIHHGTAEDVREMIKEIYDNNRVWFDKKLKSYSEKDDFEDVQDWIYYIYNFEREKNRYELIQK